MVHPLPPFRHLLALVRAYKTNSQGFLSRLPYVLALVAMCMGLRSGTNLPLLKIILSPEEGATGVFIAELIAIGLALVIAALFSLAKVRGRVDLLLAEEIHLERPEAKLSGRTLLMLFVLLLILALVLLVGYSLLVVPGLYLLVRLMPAPFIVLEGEMNPLKALVNAWRLTAGHASLLLPSALVLTVLLFLFLIAQPSYWFFILGLYLLGIQGYQYQLYLYLQGVGQEASETEDKTEGDEPATR